MLSQYVPLARNGDFRRLFVGRLVTNAGDSVYFVAAMWLVFELSGSSFYTGLAGALTLAPRTVQFMYGPLVDRWDTRRVLVGSQLGQSVVVLVLPLAATLGRLSVPLVLAVMPTLMAINQFVHPARVAATPLVVAEEHLVEANTAFSVAYQGVDMLFTAVGGVLVVAVGASALFTADSVTFVVAAGLFAAVTIPARSDDGEREALSDTYLTELREGLSYVRGTSITWMLGVPVVVNLGMGAVIGVLPAYAAGFSGPSTYGLLLATTSSGMLVGSVAASSLKRTSLTALHGVGFLASSGLWLAAVWIHSQYVTAALFLLAWIPVGLTNVLFWTIIQTYVPQEFVGRASSVSMSAAVLWIPVGSLLGGVVADATTPGTVMVAVGVGFAFAAVYWLAHPILRGLPSVSDIDAEEHGFGTS